MEKNVKKNYVYIRMTGSLCYTPATNSSVDQLCIETKTKRFPETHQGVWVSFKWQPTPVFLPGESQGRGSLVGCRPRGRTESDTTEAT